MVAAMIAAMIGTWLIIAPWALQYGQPAAMADRIAGPIIAAMGIIAVFDVMRFVRWINFAAAIWLILAPLVLASPAEAAASSVLSGLVLATASSIRGYVHPHMGGGWRALWSRRAARRQFLTASTPD